MSEEASHEFQQEPSPSQHGQWRQYGKEMGWTTPTDAVLYCLNDVRRDPKFILQLVGEDLSGEYEQGKPLPLQVELRALLRGGNIGRNPDQSIVTVTEFLAVAPAIYGLDLEQMADLETNLLPTAEAWDAKMEEKDIEKKNQALEEVNRLILETWTKARFDELVQHVLPHATIPDIQERLDTFTRQHGNDLVRTLDAAEDAIIIEDSTQRRFHMESSTSTILHLASLITRIHPEELKKIAESERYHGYLFLDSVTPQLPILDATYDVIDELHTALKETGSHVTNDGESLHAREEAIKQLRYGGENEHAVQDIAGFLEGKGVLDAHKHTAAPENQTPPDGE